MYLAWLLANLPNVVLAAIVLVAVKGLIKIDELRRLWQVSRFEFTVSMVAFAAVLLLGILNGVLIAVLASLLLLIRRTAHAHVAFLGRIPGTRRYSDMERNPENEPIRGALVFRVEASLLYFNVEGVRDALWKKISDFPKPLELVVCDLSSSPYVDLAGARMLASLHATLAEMGVELKLVNARAAVRILRASGLDERLGYLDQTISLPDLMDRFLGRPGTPAVNPAP
jgi:MFS superfamily sulfate permease-like transporter